MKKIKLLILFMSVFVVSCSKPEDDDLELQLPVLTTSEVNDIDNATASSGGAISSDGGSAVIARGVVWNTTENPTTADGKTTDGHGTGSFSSNITGLTANTTYYLRAYATNSVGTAYGNQLSFTTTDTEPSGTSREYTVDITRNPTGDSRSQSVSGGPFQCMYVDGALIDMDSDAVEYIVKFYDMKRSREGGTTTHPADVTYKFLADAGNEVLNGVHGDRNYINWYSSPRAGTVTRFTPQNKLFVMISWCSTSGCVDNCWVINGKAQVTVLY